MTDRELLELAAKAASLEIMPLAQEGRDKAGYGAVGLYVRRSNGDLLSTCWNPLTSDGDALCLAVACDMTVCADGLATVSASSGYGHDKVMVTQTVSECGKDKSAATRRAIVRAAAEIGRAMP